MPYYSRLKTYIGKALDICGINYISRRLNRGKTLILLYHGIIKKDKYLPKLDFGDLCITKESFEEHIIYLKGYFNIISLDEFISGENCNKDGMPNAVITFDDGYLNNFTQAYPVLEKHNVKATFFITSSFIDNSEPLWFNKIERLICFGVGDKILPFTALRKPLSIANEEERIEAVRFIKRKILLLHYKDFQNAIEELESQIGRISLPGDDYYFIPMKWEHVKEMADDPNITIGSHGRSHYPLSNLPEKVIWDELEESKFFIEQKIGKEVRHLSYPHGFYNEGVKKIAKACNYDTAITTIHGFNDNRINPYLLRRNEIGNSGDTAIFLSVASGSWDFLKVLLRRSAKE